MKQEICNGSGNIQINGNGNKLSIEQPGYQPEPDNPNLITCPACNRYGVFRGADKCPACHYSFLNERLAVQAEARRKRAQLLRTVFFMAICAFAISMQIPTTFEASFLMRLGWGAMIVTIISLAGFLLWGRFN